MRHLIGSVTKSRRVAGKQYLNDSINTPDKVYPVIECGCGWCANRGRTS